jgi:diguanylate cyclase (GGDEF)-like protein
LRTARLTRAGEGPRISPPRAAARTGGALLTLSVITLAALAAAYLVSGATHQLWVANAGWTCGSLTSVIGVLAAWRRSAAPARSGWALVLGGCVAWLAGQLFWDLYSFTSFPASPNPADLCAMVFAVLTAAGVRRLGLGGRRSRSVSWLELAPLVVAVCSLVTALLWRDIHASTIPGGAQLSALAYPVFYVSAALVTLQTALAGAIDVRRNLGMAAVLGGVLIEALAYILWAELLFEGTYVPGTNPVDVLWGLGMVLIGVGAWAAGPVAAVPGVERASRRRGGILPALTLLALVGAQIASAATDAMPGTELALSIGVAVVGATLVVRASILRRKQDALYARLDERGRELEIANERLSIESRRDPLTGLGNRLRLHEDLAELAARAERYGQGYSLVLCDLDRFKDYNDELGHQAGDSALQRVAALLNDRVRAGDRAYRYGGEELLLILPEQDIDDAQAVAERHRANVEAVALLHPENPPHRVVTFSAGVAVAQAGETPEQVLKRADEALYAAKHAGRNRVVAARPAPGAKATGPG